MTEKLITITEPAAERVKSFLAKEAGLGLRFGVKKSGCSGWAYYIEIAKDAQDTDHVFEQFGIKVYVNNESLDLVAGTEIDYTKVGLGESFKFSNPNVTAECGCGESFTTSAA
jgi:iron-sulfur cluster assembly protein